MLAQVCLGTCRALPPDFKLGWQGVRKELHSAPWGLLTVGAGAVPVLCWGWRSVAGLWGFG